MGEAAPKTDPACFHCGEPCASDVVVHDEHSFCCQGCRSVYQLLTENGLSGYYDLEERPGQTIDEPPSSEKYAFLEDASMQEKILDFQDGQTARVNFTIPAIHCSSCIWLLENLYRIEPAVLSSVVDLGRKEADLTFDQQKVSLRQVVQLLDAIGYPPSLELNSEKDGEGTKDRSLAYKIGVAGFCFGNIMLLSLPEYLGADFQLDRQYLRFFSFLNLFLALPVFFYAASGHFTSAWKGLRHRYINIDVPVSLGIFALFSRSTYEILSGTGVGYMDSLAGLVFFLLVGRWVQERTYKALDFDRDDRSYLPLSATRLENGEEVVVPVSDIHQGDRLLIRNQEMIPADGILVSGSGNIDNSFITGESRPVPTNSGEKVHAGAKQIGEPLEILVEKEPEETYLRKLWGSTAFRNKSREGVQGVVDRVSKYFTIVILLIAFGSAVYWWFFDPGKIVLTFTAVLIIACPCALALTVPFSLGNMHRLFGRAGFYAREAGVIEQMWNIDEVVFDKTGTLTTNNRDPVHQGPEVAPADLDRIAKLAGHSVHPLSRSLFASLSKRNPVGGEVTDFKEYPGKGIEGRVEGKLIRIGSWSWVHPDREGSDNTITRVYVSIDGVDAGSFSFINEYRQGVNEGIDRLKGEYGLHLVSGDKEGERTQLEPVFGKGTPLLFNQKPEDKVIYIQNLKNKKKGIMMVGDGLNDTGALNQSDVGVAVAEDIFRFTPSSDVILSSGEVAGLDRFLKASRGARKVIWASFVISFMYNLVGIGFAVSGMLTPVIAAILMPLSSVTVVAFVTLATGWVVRWNKVGR